MAYTTATLTGTYETTDGDPATGIIQIIPNSRYLIDAEGNTILSGRVTVTLDGTGSFSVVLPSTDDATVEPAVGRQYTVAPKILNLPAVTGITLPGGTTRDMADLTSATAVVPAVSGGPSGAVFLALSDALDDETAARIAGDTSLDGRLDTIEAIGAASTSAQGYVELATTGEAVTGTDTARAVTPAGILAAFQAFVAGAPGALDTWLEIVAQVQADQSGLGAMTTLVNVKAGTAVVTRYTTPQTDTAYVIPAGAKSLVIRAQGPAGGGGSGRRGAAGGIRCGGGGGGAGAFTDLVIDVVNDLTANAVSTLYVTIPAAGVGGAAVDTDDTNGNNGTPGSTCTVGTSTSLTYATNIARAGGGASGGGGTNVGGAAGTGTAGAGAGGRFGGNNGAAASTTGLVGTAAAGPTNAGTPGGGAGGGLTAANAQSAGGNGSFTAGGSTSPPAGGIAGGGAGTAGLNGPRLHGGQSGAGGGSNASGAGGAGGSAGIGAGGGGGGASVNGSASGAGGNGGDGFVEITALF